MEQLIPMTQVAALGMTHTNSVLADDGGFQRHVSDSHSGSEHTE
jgi:hypothetical protein